MTIAQLIDHLRQFPDATQVVLTADDAPAEGEFIVLDWLDFTPETTKE